MIASEVSVQSEGVTLVGTKVVPEHAKAVVLLVHGSGPLDRDQNSKAAKLETFSYLATAFADAGYASIRWDKRGIGASGGDYQALRQAQLVADVRAWIGAAQNLGPIYLLGHSEGTAIATEAAQGQDVAGLILICPYITPGGEILVRQAAKADVAVDQLTGLGGWLARITTRIIGRPSQVQARIVRKLAQTDSAYIRVGLRKVPAHWLRDFVAADLDAIHRSNQRPTLLIVAAHDAQCPPEDGARIAALNAQAELRQISGLSHILRPTDNDSLADYPRQLKIPNDPRVAETVLDWLRRQ
ncbi:alpha/beta fold hydrolase [Cognatiyoonia sp. IB215446]|uniref:alpha/beta hydrolase n=1 Tax=Cognatiyoonia sp. IB215446 TaxID=3097355 RepID=UPI002A0AA8AA|nr:alpha/beta fold hydrolase [Cognatiyoonia sp. IB215446]MDX8348551.1 alpha/beta fold hydrolase [Cognatiyoonia sp. IB215446]